MDRAETPASASPDRTPLRAGRWLVRAAGLGVLAGALAWSCSPGFVAISLLGDLSALAPMPGGPASPEERTQCRAGLERLGRAHAVARFWPPLREVLEVQPPVFQRAQLFECAGDVAQARHALVTELVRLEAGLAGGPIDWTRATPDELRAVEAPTYCRALADLEERAGNPAAALAAYQRQVAVSADLDGAGWGIFTADAVSDLLRYLVRSGDRDRARELYRTELGAAEASGASEAVLVPVLEAYAELLEVEGNEREASDIYARIGRAGLEGIGYGD